MNEQNTTEATTEGDRRRAQVVGEQEVRRRMVAWPTETQAQADERRLVKNADPEAYQGAYAERYRVLRADEALALNDDEAAYYAKLELTGYRVTFALPPSLQAASGYGGRVALYAANIRQASLWCARAQVLGLRSVTMAAPDFARALADDSLADFVDFLYDQGAFVMRRSGIIKTREEFRQLLAQKTRRDQRIKYMAAYQKYQAAALAAKEARDRLQAAYLLLERSDQEEVLDGTKAPEPYLVPGPLHADADDAANSVYVALAKVTEQEGEQ